MSEGAKAVEAISLAYALEQDDILRSEISELRASVKTLERTLKRQQAAIDALEASTEKLRAAQRGAARRRVRAARPVPRRKR